MSHALSTTTNNHRAHPRAPVRWAAYWTDGLRARTGEIRDISRNGIFLSPAWRPSTSYTAGDEIAVRCAIDGFAVDLKTVVRWSGVSSEHGCEGLGLEVVAPLELDPLIERARAHTPSTSR